MSGKFLVFLEQRDNKIKKASLETLSKASQLAKTANSSIDAVLLGGEVENIDMVNKYLDGKLYYLKNEKLSYYSNSAYSKIISEFVINNTYENIFLANTSIGKDLAPFLAVDIDAGIAMDCVKLEIEEGTIKAQRPVYAGKALLNLEVTTERKIFTLRPNVFELKEISDNNFAFEERDVHEVNESVKIVSIEKSEGKLDVAEAEIIVSGGRGLKEPSNFALLEELAKELGAAVGASRAAVDAGWRPHSDQVGQTGKTVSPNLYIACGISGAIQHLAGMRSSQYIVAVNKDKDAPIFGVADYGIAGDLFEVVPAMIEEIKKIKS